MYERTSELYNDLVETYFNEYYDLSDAERKKMKLKKLFLKAYNYDVWFENEESTDKEDSTDDKKSADLYDIPPLEGNEEEVKERKGLKILTPNKLLTRFLLLLAQIKARNNSDKLKSEIRHTISFVLAY